MKKPFYLMALTVILGCWTNKSTEVEFKSIEIISTGLISCINFPKGVTCFGGHYPEAWDIDSLPDVPITLYVPGRKAILVGMMQVCLDDNRCFGDPLIGSLTAANSLLTGVNFQEWRQLEAGINIICGLGHNGQVKCWGIDWGIARDGDLAEIRQPVGTFEHFSLGPTDFCGTTGRRVSCQPLSHYGAQLADGFKEYEGYRNSCSSLVMDCAESVESRTDIKCWFQTGKPLELSKVKEFGCGGMVCANMGTHVECHSPTGETKLFPVKIRNLSVGSQHFCGVDKNNHVVCRVFGELVEDVEARTAIELISVHGWNELLKVKD